LLPRQRTEDEVERRMAQEGEQEKLRKSPIGQGYLQQRTLYIRQPLDRVHLTVPPAARLSKCGNRVEWRDGLLEKWPPELLEAGGLIQFRDIKEGLGVLQDFIETRSIHGGSAEGVVAFVGKWGPLSVRPRVGCDGLSPEFDGPGPENAWYSEPVGEYQRRARSMWGILAVAAALHMGKEIGEPGFGAEELKAAGHGGFEPDVWAWGLTADHVQEKSGQGGLEPEVWGDPEKLAFLSRDRSPAWRRTHLWEVLAHVIRHEFMYEADFKLAVGVQEDSIGLGIGFSDILAICDWDREASIWPRAEARAEELRREGKEVEARFVLHQAQEHPQFPARPRPSVMMDCLVLQLLSSVSLGVYRCSACGNPYEPSRRPSAGQGHYCKREACQSEAVLRRVRRHQQKRRGATTTDQG